MNELITIILLDWNCVSCISNSCQFIRKNAVPMFSMNYYIFLDIS